MSGVLTEEQARSITGGRKPLVPVEYENALQSLAQCASIDDAKYWSDKADALAAWAKIYQSDQVSVQAKRLKLHAFRRIGILAAELRPRTRGGGPGPKSLLVEKGFAISQATTIQRVTNIPRGQFEAFVNLPRPPSPTAIRNQILGEASDAWKILAAQSGTSLLRFATWCRANGATSLARGVSIDEGMKIRAALIVITEWLDEFEAYLPNAKGQTK